MRQPRTLATAAAPLFIAAALGLGACADQTPTGPAPSGPIRATATAQSGRVVSGATFVNFAETIPAAFARDVVAAGGEVVFAFPEIGVVVIRGLDDAATARTAAVHGAVSFGADPLTPATPEQLPRIAAGEFVSATSGEPFASALWGMRMIGADRAIDAGYMGEGAVIGVVDSGIDYTHPDLAGNYLRGRNFFAPFCASDPAPLQPVSCNPADPMDQDGHGSHVAGTVAAALTGAGVYGVAPKAKLIAAKVCGENDCPTSSLIAGILYAADQGVDAMNLSIGGYLVMMAPDERADFVAFKRATNYANRRGALVVNSAGNAGLDLQRLPGYVKRIFGEANNMLVVSAVGPDEALGNVRGTVYSNFGSIVDVAAPGGSFPPLANLVLSTVPGGYAYYAGTSMAAPHVTGTAAQIVGRFGKMNPSQLRTRIQQSAVDRGKVGRDPIYGHGIVNVWNAVR
jgi:subtilisin family serine protease